MFINHPVIDDLLLPTLWEVNTN